MSRVNIEISMDEIMSYSTRYRKYTAYLSGENNNYTLKVDYNDNYD